MSRLASTEVVGDAIRGGDSAADALIRAIWPVCFRLAATVLGDRALAEDAAQNACVIVLRSIRRLRAAEAFDTWLYRIVMREASRVRRKHRSDTVEPYSEFTADVSIALDVWRALGSIPPDLRDVTVLFYFDDLKGDEIAAVLGISHGTVRSRLNRARTALRGLLDEYHPSPSTLEASEHAV